MFDPSRRRLLQTLAGAAMLGATAAASAQSGANVIKVIVPFVAGGITDQVARGVLDRVSKSLAQTLVIENRPGAGSRIGSETVMRADPDGTTLLFTNPSYSILPITDTAVKYDPVKALAPVALVGTYGLPVVVSNRLPVNTLGEFIAHARKHPGQLSYGSAGMGSGAHFAGEFFQSLTGTEMVHVPYKSTAAAIIDVAGGVLDLTFDATAKSYADAGKVKIVAVTGKHRDPRLPLVPTAAESGLKDFVLGSWLGLFAPVGTPAAVVERLNKAVNAALADPGLVKQMEDLGITASSGSPLALGSAVQQDMVLYRRIANDAKLTFRE
ncbi:Bug family tripartite tricarboxylate transporter substrate binding protein [Hydrogenophaga luteola]|uniref:Bug family tripartite tricarboxylate transporter substrate binding protein n=1 Tax=Hydrogenophaga luteola TaxID=1591122 RepID=A0ABV7VYJ2_9BURK